MAYASIAARVLAAICWILSGGELPVALKIWKSKREKYGVGRIAGLHSFITTWGPRFLQSGTVHNLPRKKVPRKVPDEVAKQCVDIVKRGYYQRRQCNDPQGSVVEVHVYWTSIKIACADNRYLRWVCRTYSTSPAGLLRRMHQVDRNFKWRRLTFKWELTPLQKLRRKCVAILLLNYVSIIPDFLKRIFWIDECVIWLTARNVDVHVYADAHDQNVSAVMAVPGLQADTKIKVRVFAVVNALLGPFFIDFTTGTTQLQRRHIHPPRRFKVSLWEVEGCSVGAVPAEIGSRA